MKIFGAILSPYVARVPLALRHKGVTHEITMPKDGTKSPAFLKMNPLGKMPVMKDGATVLFESGVILEYIDAKHKKKRIIPADAKAAAKVRLVGALFGEYVQPNIGSLFYQLDPAKRDHALVTAKIEEIGRLLDIAEKMIGKPYAAGKAFSIADCYAAPALFFADSMLPVFGVERPLARFKKLSAYLAKARKDKVIGSVLRDMDAAWAAWNAPKTQAA